MEASTSEILVNRSILSEQAVDRRIIGKNEKKEKRLMIALMAKEMA